VSCQRQHNKLLCCDLNTTTQHYSYTKSHDTTIGCVVGFCIGNCRVVASQHKNSLCCESAIIGNTTNCCVASFCVGRLALRGHRDLRQRLQSLFRASSRQVDRQQMDVRRHAAKHILRHLYRSRLS